MRQLPYFFMTGIAMCLLMSCEKVVTADLRDSAPRYVIEGIINNAGKCSVLISSTMDIDHANEWKGKSGALVQVTDNGGAAISLTEKSQGIYSTLALRGVPGHTYQLTVTLDGHVYTASSTMPKPVALTSVTATMQASAGKSRYVANARYTDPDEPGNYYHFTQSVNRRSGAAIFVTNDQLNNGETVTYSLESPLTLQTGSTDIEPGDTVAVEMQSIDAAVYKYWYSLNASASGSDMLATPSNPVSNISGGALGYFSAHTSQTKRVIVK